MHQLKTPCKLSRSRVESHHRVCPLVISGTEAAVIVWTRAPSGDKDQITRQIHGHDRPGICCSSDPWRDRTRYILRNGVPTPSQGSSTRIKGPHDSRRHVDPWVVVNGRSYDDHIV